MDRSRVKFSFCVPPGVETRLPRKRTGMPDHTRDSQSATKRERDVDTAKLKAGGALTGGRLGPLQGGPRAKAKCGAGRAKRGGAGCS